MAVVSAHKVCHALKSNEENYLIYAIDSSIGSTGISIIAVVCEERESYNEKYCKYQRRMPL